MSEKSFNPDFPSATPTIFRSSYLEPTVPPLPPLVPIDNEKPIISGTNSSVIGEKAIDRPVLSAANSIGDNLTERQVISNANSIAGDKAPGSLANSVAGDRSTIVRPIVSMANGGMTGEMTRPIMHSMSVPTSHMGSPNMAGIVPMQTEHPLLANIPSQYGITATLPDVALVRANFELQVELEKATSRVRSLDKENKELLDRLEKALVISARLKDIEKQHNELKDKFVESETALRASAKLIDELESVVQSKSEMLASVRSKYFSEKERNDKQLVEIETVRTAAELAKQELDLQAKKTVIREHQLITAKSLITSGQVFDAPTIGLGGSQMRINPLMTDDELRMTNHHPSTDWLLPHQHSSVLASPVSGVTITSLRDWQATQTYVPNRDMAMTAVDKRLLLSGSSSMSGTLVDDKVIRVSMSNETTNVGGGARVYITVTNTCASLIQNIRIVSAHRASSSFDFALQSVHELLLKPGQHVSTYADFAILSVFDPAVSVPNICVSYQHGGDLPKNYYMRIPLHVAKFLRPVKPEAEALLAKWNDFVNNEATIKVAANNELSAFSSLMPLGELGGCMLAQRGIDPYPRGMVFAGALPAGQHGLVKEVIARLELTPIDQRGPPMIRITVRSPQLLLSKSVMSSLISIIS